MPDTFGQHRGERGRPRPYGAKGEGALAGVAAAIATALADAGLKVDELPATPERVWRALASREDGTAKAPLPAHGEREVRGFSPEPTKEEKRWR